MYEYSHVVCFYEIIDEGVEFIIVFIIHTVYGHKFENNIPL